MKQQDTLPAIPAWKAIAGTTDIIYEKCDEGIAKITINRPEVRNAFRPETVKELQAAFADARDDQAIGVIILTGQGKDAFCSGGDQRVRGLAVGTAKRFPGAPEIPTLAESGLRGFEASAWDGIFVPAGTPAAIVEQLNAAIRAALDDPELVAELLKRGAVPVAGSSESFARFIAVSAERWAIAVRSSGAKID